MIEHNSFAHHATETPAYVKICITDKRKSVYRMNDERFLVKKNLLLKEQFPGKGFAEILISNEKPMILKYNKNSEVLTTEFNYGFWNSYGVSEH